MFNSQLSIVNRQCLPPLHCNEGDYHFLHRYSAVLEGVAVVGGVVVVVVRVGEEVVAVAEDVGGA